jgi:hypothetical protein
MKAQEEERVKSFTSLPLIHRSWDYWHKSLYAITRSYGELLHIMIWPGTNGKTRDQEEKEEEEKKMMMMKKKRMMESLTHARRDR